MGGKGGALYVRLVLGVMCITAGIAAGQMVDQRLMLVAMFPAAALLSGVVASLTAPRPPRTKQPPPLSAAERELLAAVWNAGRLGSAGASEKTSLSEVEAASSLAELARKGYLRGREVEGETVYERATGYAD